MKYKMISTFQTFFIESGNWNLPDGSTPKYYLNWWNNSCHHKNKSCATVISSGKSGRSYENKWVPYGCDKKLPFLCRIHKGNNII